MDRTRATPYEGCEECLKEDYIPQIDTVIVDSTCLQGDIRLKEGYNCDIVQINSENRIIIRASVGAGEGETCKEIVLREEEENIPIDPETGFPIKPLSGGPWCNNTLRSICGVGGPLFTMIASTGVSIVPDPVEHKLTIDVNMLGLSTCYNEYEVIETTKKV